MTTTAYAWAPIVKSEEQDDGTLVVYGAATDASLDRDRQRMDQAWLDQAMPKWMAEGGNIREQHDPKRAVGVGIGLHKDENTGAWMLTSRVVDPVAVLKVKTGVLKGYSIGVKDPHVTMGKAEAPAGLIDGGTVCETSLADRPSNPGSYFMLAKADDSGELVVVEDAEVVEESDDAAKAEQILADIDALLPDLAKADQSGDIATAQQAIAVIATLIQSEAQSLGAGQLSDAYDIKCLLNAVCALKYFIQCEGQEVQPNSTGGDSLQANIADSMDIAGSAYEMKADTATPEITKAETPDLAAIVEAAITKAAQVSEERFKTLEAQLTKVLAMPEPGGPVAMRTASQAVAARGVDAVSLRREAERLIAKADDTAREDPVAARGYRDRAAELLAKADA